jgi:hypothetical protein
MDILNWLFIKRQQLIKTEANDASTDLVALGAEVPFTTRGDGYQTYAMPLANAVASADAANTGSYELDLTLTNTVTVTTQKGIIDIVGMGLPGNIPDVSFGSAEVIYINNPELDLTLANRENIYIQYSLYYSPTGDDTAIPYVLATTAPSGIEFSIFNASPVAAGADQWTGAFYLYYELYTK